MSDAFEKTQELKKYIKKLIKFINNESTFKFMKTRLVDKTRVDDIICCIDASFPKEYLDHLKKIGGNHLKSTALYTEMLNAIKNPFWLSPSLYSVNYNAFNVTANAFIKNIDSDIKKVSGEIPNNF